MAKIIENTKNRIIAVIDSNESLANAIRRSASETPVLAIDEVEIHKNDSALYDEVIAHRIGLIPIKGNRKLEYMEDSDKASGKKNLKGEIILTLKAKGPCTVYAKDLKGDVEVIYGDMPIVLLTKDQELEIMCYARLGKSEYHSKYSPGLVYYRKISDIYVKEAAGAEKVLEKIKTSLTTPIKGGVKKGEIYKSYLDIDFIETLLPEIKEGSIEVKPGNEIVFFIESWGQVDAYEIFNESVKALDKNFKEVLKALKK